MHSTVSQLPQRINRLLKSIKAGIHTQGRTINLSVWRVSGEPVTFSEAAKQHYIPFSLNESWGEPWSTWWFKFTISIPNEWKDKIVELVIDPGFVGDWPGNQSEGLLRMADGTILKAINPQNQIWRIPNDLADNTEIYFEAAANPDVMAQAWEPTDLGDVLTAKSEKLYTFNRAEIALFQQEIWDLYFDFEIILGVFANLDETDSRRAELAVILSNAADQINYKDIAATAAKAREILRQAFNSPAVSSAHHLHAIGHAHIDSAWLWPLRETERKVLRTFSNVLWLMEQYPDFRFAASSAQQYDWVKKRDPDLFERIKEAVKRGQWIPVGGQWVEADGVLPSGESLVRQLTFGQEFFKKEFGVRSSGMWLPDSFGYTASYPQIAAAGDMQWFLTQKISWNQTNKFPHHSFWWEGIDGTRLFTHFCPADCYDSVVEPKQLIYASKNFKDQGPASHSLLPFGHGDGGGGPIREMMERCHRAKDFEGLPRTTIDTPQEFFELAKKEYQDQAQVWAGELYLELHRGTFTSQAPGKYGNRRCESMLQTAEFINSMATVLAGAQYPYEELDRIWKRVLLLQFHDILPGSSIAWVNREANAEYLELMFELANLIKSGIASLETNSAAETNRKSYFNTAPVPSRKLVNLDGVASLVTIKPGSSQHQVVPASNLVSRNGNIVTNGLITVSFNDQGLIKSVYDQRNKREIIPTGVFANQFVCHQDVPNNWDAWDIDRHYLNQAHELSKSSGMRWIEESDLACTAEIKWQTGQSVITQRVTISADSRWIDFENDIDWQERKTLLKWAFPTTLFCKRAKAEMQFGHIERDIHENTSWDFARFETAGHRWIQIAEGDYGFAIANDATYGFDVQRKQYDNFVGSTPRLSVLRGPEFPDPNEDKGQHIKRWSVGVGVNVSQTIQRGYEVNIGLVECKLAPMSFLSAEGKGIYLETVKLADDGSGDVVARVYEGLGATSQAVLIPSFNATAASFTNLYEDETANTLERNERGHFCFELRPFQMVTIRIARDKEV